MRFLVLELVFSWEVAGCREHTSAAEPSLTIGSTTLAVDCDTGRFSPQKLKSTRNEMKMCPKRRKSIQTKRGVQERHY